MFRISILGMVLIASTLSCELAYIVVDVVEPPPLPLPENVTKISLNNRLTDSILNFTGDDFMLKGSNLKEIRSIAALKTIGGMEEVFLKKESFMVTGKMLESTVMEDADDLPIRISAQTIREICTEQDCDVLLSLESLWFSSDISYDSFLAKEPRNQNQIWSNTITYDARRIEYFNALLTVHIKLGWRVYEPESGAVLYEGYQRDSVFYEVQGRSEEEAEKKLPSTLNVVEKAGFLTGIQISERLSPSLITVERYYYRSANKDFGKANELAKFRRWDDAANLWEPYLSSSHKAVKAMACYNMALIHEMDGNLEEAKRLVNIAAGLVPWEEVIEYKKVLDSR